MAQVKAEIKDDKLVVEIPAEYLKRAFLLGVTTNNCGRVTDQKAMLKHFSREFTSGIDDDQFGRFIDVVCSEAIENGELFVEPDEDEIE
ncbi:hypothetical protein [Vibrio sp. SCSIO 43136]|uniref:hypothetical protein n=1 Tax=Vibrio sp. SCSIO 43136 TaxID=2819101 RepID=UPI0020752655|nr:hypothetical protein [Vibrio sp. SCSIO 43136]USD68113.1 hypothetical protein J4N39_18230 [Vibrio sp. SCSIO 43136]